MAEWTTPDAIHSKCGEEEYNEATKAIDDNTGTFWKHIATEYHWIIFDMGESDTITKIQIYQGSSAYRFGKASGLYVYVGDDPADLGDAVWEGVLNASGWQESGSFSKVGRYVKLVSKSNTTFQYIYEFDAYVGVLPVIPVGGTVQKARLLDIVATKQNVTVPFKNRFPTFTPRVVT